MSGRTQQGTRRVLVTGASRGIGRAIALALAGHGLDVALGYLRSKAAAEALSAESAGRGRQVERQSTRLEYTHQH